MVLLLVGATSANAQVTLPETTVTVDLPPGSSQWPGAFEAVGAGPNLWQVHFPPEDSSDAEKNFWVYTQLWAQYRQEGDYRDRPNLRQGVVAMANDAYSNTDASKEIESLLTSFDQISRTTHNGWLTDPNYRQQFSDAILDSFRGRALMDQGLRRGIDPVTNFLQSKFYPIITRQIALTLPEITVSATAIDNPGTQMSGSFFTPMAAWYFYLQGNALPRSVAFDDIGIHPGCADFPLAAAVASHTTTGTFPIYVNAPFYTGRDSVLARLYLGTITLKLDGNMTRNPDGSWVINGSISAFHDVYDANASNHRNELDEDMTTMLDLSGRLFQGKPYDIDITGSEDITCTN